MLDLQNSEISVGSYFLSQSKKLRQKKNAPLTCCAPEAFIFGVERSLFFSTLLSTFFLFIWGVTIVLEARGINKVAKLSIYKCFRCATRTFQRHGTIEKWSPNWGSNCLSYSLGFGCRWICFKSAASYWKCTQKR